jgi:hypothetical protein
MTEVRKAKVSLFKPSGKWYTDEEWTVPKDAYAPICMIDSPDFRRIDDGPVLVLENEWGYPHLLLKSVHGR